MVDDHFVSASVDSRVNHMDGPRQLQIMERNNNLELDNSFEYLTPMNEKPRHGNFRVGHSDKSPPYSIMKKSGRGDGKLKILENNGLMVIRDGQVMNNEQLLDKIKVPEKIQRKFTIARDYAE